MDQPVPPTAAELGISEAAYERILSDLGHRPGRRAARRTHQEARIQVAPARAARAGYGRGFLTRLGASDPDDREPTYAFLQTVEGQPVTYSSCRLVHLSIGLPLASSSKSLSSSGSSASTGLDDFDPHPAISRCT